MNLKAVTWKREGMNKSVEKYRGCRTIEMSSSPAELGPHVGFDRSVFAGSPPRLFLPQSILSRLPSFDERDRTLQNGSTLQSSSYSQTPTAAGRAGGRARRRFLYDNFEAALPISRSNNETDIEFSAALFASRSCRTAAAATVLRFANLSFVNGV